MEIAAAYNADLFVVPQVARQWALSKIKRWRGSVVTDAGMPSVPGEFAPGDQVLTLVGEHGAGKTWFLRYLAETDPWFSSSTMYLDLTQRSEFSQVADYLAAVEAHLRKACGESSAILLLDAVPPHLDEHLRALEDRILRPQVTLKASLVFMALLHPSYVCWRAPSLRGGEAFSLPAFDESHTREQLKRLTHNVPVQDGLETSRLQADSGGLPLLTYLLATQRKCQAYELLLEHWFSRVPADEQVRVRNYLEAVCCLDVLEHAAVQRALDAYARYRPAAAGFPAHAGGVRNILRKYWLARPSAGSPGRIVLIDSVRRAARQTLEVRDAELYAFLRNTATATGGGPR